MDNDKNKGKTKNLVESTSGKVKMAVFKEINAHK